jgi:nucleoside-diphosphate-sugar epimerase
MTRILVTGANGFLGGAISERLAARGDLEVAAAARGDLAHQSAAVAALYRWRPDVVVHAAGRTHGSADRFQVDNVDATAALAAAIALAAPNCGLILLGSAAQYGHSQDRIPWRERGPCEPLDDYGTSKLVAEASAFAQAAQSGIRVTSLRIFNVIAPWAHGEQSFPSFLRKLAAAMAGPPPWRVGMGRLTAVRDFVALDDVLQAVDRVIDRDIWGQPINVCTGVGRTVGALLEEVGGALDGDIVIEQHGPAPMLDWSIGDPALCQAKLGFTPSSDLTALIAEAAAWVQNVAQERADA